MSNYTEIKKNLPKFEVEVVLINDGSKIGIEVENIIFLKSKIKKFKYISYQENKGKGFAVRKGFNNVSFDNVVFTDIDFPYSTESLVLMVKKLFNNEGDIIVGVRNNEYYINVPFYRKMISKSLIKLNEILLNLPFGETQAGLKAFSKKGKEAMLNSKIDSYLFDIEVLKIGKKMECKIISSEISLRNEIIFSKMGIKTLLKEFFSFIKILFKF